MSEAKKYGFAVAFVMLTGLLLSPCQGFAEAVLVAKVGNISVTEEDLQREIQKRIPMQVSFHGGMKPEKLEKIRNEAKESLITRAYKVQYALDAEMVVDAKTVDEEWTKVVSKNPGIAQAKNQQNDALKTALYFDLLAKKAEYEAVDRKVVVADAEVKQYYEKNKGQFFQAKLFKVSHIFVKVDPSDSVEQKEARKKKAETLLGRAKAGEDFYNLAYYESDDRTRYVGGSLGSIHAGQTAREFDEVLQKMKPGEVVGPVKTLYGYHVIKLDEVQEERQLSFEQSADRIKQMLNGEKRKKLYDDWMNVLRQKYPVKNP